MFIDIPNQTGITWFYQSSTLVETTRKQVRLECFLAPVPSRRVKLPWSSFCLSPLQQVFPVVSWLADIWAIQACVVVQLGFSQYFSEMNKVLPQLGPSDPDTGLLLVAVGFCWERRQELIAFAVNRGFLKLSHSPSHTCMLRPVVLVSTKHQPIILPRPPPANCVL